MRYYFAPLEGITDSIFRRLHHKYFPGMDRYYTPFFCPTAHRALTPKESRELPIADSLGFQVVPQLLTKVPDDFLWMAQQCCELGYREVNLNIGCPSGTVTAKGKGSGMLKDPEALDSFLYEIFSRAPLDISVKTRIGFSDPEEFPALLDVFNRYPIKELTIHPRVRDEFYNGSVNTEAFHYAVENSNAPVCYNGNLISKKDIHEIGRKFPSVKAVMLGRGLIADPGMLCAEHNNTSTLEQFYSELLESYIRAFGSERNAMFRMKENWRYLIRKFEGADKAWKKLRKTTSAEEYRAITNDLFRNYKLTDTIVTDW